MCRRTSSCSSRGTHAPDPLPVPQREGLSWRLDRREQQSCQEDVSDGQGKSSHAEKNNLTGIFQLENVPLDRDIVIKASLVCSDDVSRAHVHKLMGKNCLEDGSCCVTLDQEGIAVYV